MAANDEKKLFKFSVFLYKKDEVSYEDWAKFATETYPPRAIPVMKKYGLVKFSQTLTHPHFREPFRHALKEEMGRPEWTVPDYDMVATYWLRDLADMEKMTKSPEWAELEKDALPLTNISIGHLDVGHEIVYFNTDNV